jgi:N-acetylmuramoyl-L-alanine amidase
MVGILESVVEQLTEEEIFVLTLYGECNGEPYVGQLAVACVIRNRVIDSRWPDTYEEVCLQPKQFSCWNAVLPTGHLRAILNLDITKRLRFIAEGIRTGVIPDITDGANHYINPFAGPPEPKWAQNVKPITLWPSAFTGSHAFYRL